MTPNPFLKDAWDWPYILYVGRVWLHYTEKEIWALTPRQLKAQLEVHNDIKRALRGEATQRGELEQFGFIDEIPEW